MKRKLSDVEKKITVKQVARIKEEIKHLEWLSEYNSLMVDKGYHMNYLEKLRIGRAQCGELDKSIKLEQDKLKILADQMENGVEIKIEKADKQGSMGSSVVGVG